MFPHCLHQIFHFIRNLHFDKRITRNKHKRKEIFIDRIPVCSTLSFWFFERISVGFLGCARERTSFLSQSLNLFQVCVLKLLLLFLFIRRHIWIIYTIVDRDYNYKVSAMYWMGLSICVIISFSIERKILLISYYCD